MIAPLFLLFNALSLSHASNSFSLFETPAVELEQPRVVVAPHYGSAYRGLTDKRGYIVPEKLKEDLARLNKRHNRQIVDLDALFPLVTSRTASPVIDGKQRFAKRVASATPTSSGKKCSPGFLLKTACVKVCPAAYLADTRSGSCLACPAQATCRNGLVTSCKAGFLVNAVSTACISCSRGAICTSGKVSSCQTAFLLNPAKTGCSACPANSVCTNGVISSCKSGYAINAAKLGCALVPVKTTPAAPKTTTTSKTVIPTTIPTTVATTTATNVVPIITITNVVPTTTTTTTTTTTANSAVTTTATTITTTPVVATTTLMTTISSTTSLSTATIANASASASPSSGSCPATSWSYYPNFNLGKAGKYYGPNYTTAYCAETAARSQGHVGQINAIAVTQTFCNPPVDATIGPKNLTGGSPGWESFLIGCCADNLKKGAPASSSRACRNVLVTSTTITEADGSAFQGVAYKKSTPAPSPGTFSVPLQFPDHTQSSKTGGFLFIGKASVGTPAKEFSLLWDTGSPLLWIDGSTCVDGSCDGKNLYDNTTSSTFAAGDGLTSRITYGDGTYADVVPFRDTVTVGGAPATDFYLAQAYDQSGGWKRGASDGNFGMSFNGPDSGYKYEATLIQQLAAQKVIAAEQFSMKLSYDDSAELLLGGMNPDLYVSGTTEWTPLVDKDQIFWSVQTTMQVNGVTIGNENSGSFVDSGTVYLILQDDVAQAAFESIPGWGYYQNSTASNMYTYPCATPPVITFSFRGGKTKWPITNDVLNLGQVTETNCLASVMGGATEIAAGHILGDAFMQNVYSTFDSAGQRMGFSVLS